MTRTLFLLAVATTVAGADLLAQSNSRGPGYNAALTNISSARSWGRRGAAYPGGEVGVSFQNDLCNPGSMNIEWRAPMLPDHPKFSFLVTRLVGDRMVQISNWSYNKHAFLSLNNSGNCGGAPSTCQQPPAGGQQMGPNCTDVYANSNNGDRTYLAPPSEMNPWLGSWNPVGSYFDIGDPVQAGYPLAADGVRSLSTAGFDAVKNRVTIKEADLQGTTAGSLFFQIQVVCEGEPATNRNNNVMNRPFNLTWSGTAWSATTPTATPAAQGTLLDRWPGATSSTAGNGNDDGRFTVAVKVTGPTNGLWHYEYAVLNLDNNRGGASFRLPICANARVQNIGFRDIDTNTLNDWTGSYTGSEVAWTAPVSNPQNWNQLFNFWFDSDIAPVAGNATIDAARVGPGALNFTVPTTVPGLQNSVYLGAGCGTPSANLFANGLASAGNAAFALNLTSAANTPVMLVFSTTAGNTNLAPGCNAFIDLQNYSVVDLYLTNGSGLATVPAPIAPGTLPLDLTFQAATFIAAPPVLNLFGLSNGLTVRVAATGCQ